MNSLHPDSEKALDQETMGAVRAIVKLSNAVDDELVRRGLLNPNRLRQTEVEAAGSLIFAMSLE